MNVYELANKFRAELLAGDREAATRMVRAYGEVWLSLQRGLSQITALRNKAREATGNLKATTERELMKAIRLYEPLLAKDERYKALLAETEQLIRRWSLDASNEITAQQARAVEAAMNHAQATVVATVSENPTAAAAISQTWNRVPQEAITNLVGYMGDGTPLADVLADFAPEAVDNVKRQLLVGIAKGFNPRKISRNIRRDLGDGLDRALVIARTETLRSYRQAAVESYQANDDVVDEWMWHAHLGPRTCAACIAMHGKTFPVTVEFGSHPNCRCAPVPVTKTFTQLARDLGIDASGFGDIAEPEYGPTGEQWLEKQPESAQRQVLGAKYEAWSVGKIDLNDVVGYRNDPKWGPTRWERSAKALGIKAA